MRKMLKKVMTVFTAGALTLGAISLAACGGGFTPPTGGPSGSDSEGSNGGFVVTKGDYVYFINGVEASSADNTYGTPVKAALMRIKKSDIESKKNTAETVIPSLMVSADYTSGIYVYGDRVYYATPSTVKNLQGAIQSDYLDYKSADLNGNHIKSYFNVSDSATTYRYIEVDGTVYLVYVNNEELHSYNTSNGTDTTLAAGGTYVFDSLDKTQKYVYYTMPVTAQIDVEDGAVERSYNQIYRVSVETTEAPYEYSYRQDYLDEHDNEEPYTNLGEIVLDGIGASFTGDPTQFTHDLTSGVTPGTPIGYSYTLQSYQNGGIYFTRSDIAQTGTVGEGGWLYYLSESELESSSWNSINGNGKEYLDVVAQDTTNASTTALFYLDDEGHHYLYVSNNSIFRADVTDDTGMAETTLLTRDANGATLSMLDRESDSVYDYVYFTRSGTGGNNIYRIAYNGTAEDYKSLNYDETKPFRPQQLLEIEHARSWYPFEIIDNLLFYADAETIGTASYNYVSVLSLKNASGKLLSGEELKALNEKYDAILGDEGYIADLQSNSNTKLATAVRYYFYVGNTAALDENLQEAKDAGKADDYLYSEDDYQAFLAYTKGEGDAAEYKEYNTRSYFVTEIGKKSEADAESVDTYWKGALEHYTAPAEEEPEGLPTWAWVLIGVGIGLVVAAIGVGIYFVLRSRKQEEAPEEEKMYVDTTDDKSVDVYAEEEKTQPADEVEEAEPEEAGEAPEAEGGSEEGEAGDEPKQPNE